MPTTYSTARRRRSLTAALALGATALSSTLADAHFRLIAPGNWVVQSADGSPQKTGPCGNEAPQTPSNIVTPYRPGDTVTIQFEETVYHPGHYRVALAANSPADLPPAPPVTAGSTACGSTVIQTNPAFPILADGMLQHSSPFSGQQSFQVKLPTNVTCTACTLQIIEFMSEHSAPCFYHHCAKISIQAAPTDGGTGTTDASRDSSGAGGAAGSGASGGSGGAGVSDGSAGATGGNTSGGSGGRESGGAAGIAGAGVAGSGTSGGSAGSGGAGSAVGGAAGQAGAGGSDVETSGCGCSLAETDGRSAAAAGIVLVVALGAARRRRRGWLSLGAKRARH